MIFCEIAKIFGNKKAPKKYIILGAFLLGWRGRKRIRRGTFRFADWNILFRNAGTFRFADYKCNIKDYSKDLILKYKNFLKTEEFGSVLFSDATRGGEDIADILKKIEDMCDADVIELEDIPSLESMVHALSSKGLLSEKSIYFLRIS